MKHFFSFAFLAAALASSPLLAKDIDSSLEESLELRRISEYWKEKNYSTAKLQILNFLSKNPKNSYADQLYAMLGDLYFQEKNYSDALAAYDKIEGKEFRLKSQFHRLHSLYEMGKQEEYIFSSELFLKDPNATAEEITTVRFELAESHFCKAHAPENQEHKKELFKAALEQYVQVVNSPLSDLTLLPRAQIYAYLGDYEKAATLYVNLAHKDREKKEEYLFQAASLQLYFDKNAAIDTFGALVKMEGKNASKAAFNQLNLLFQEKRYKDFILAHEKSGKWVPQEKNSVIHYYLGKSLFKTNNYASAIDPLLHSLGSKELDRIQEKNALVTVIACAKETQDLYLFERALAHLKTAFPQDRETTHSLMMLSQLCKEKKQWAKARQAIQGIIELSPDHPQKETLLYDRALYLVHEQKWEEGGVAFEAFLKEFPSSSHKIHAHRHLVSLRLEALKEASKETRKMKQEELIQSLALALEEKKTFSSEEKQKMRFLLAKTQYELGKYEEAIGEFSEYTRDFHKDPTCADAYLLLAYCYHKSSRDEVHFVLNAERALATKPNLQGALDLHLTLFNTYLGLAEKAADEEKREMISKAAGHLFLATEKPVNRENLRWLASYYFDGAQGGKGESAERCVIVLQKLLGINESAESLSISAETLDREAEAMKLAEIYAKTDRNAQRKDLLRALADQQRARPNLKWKYQRMAHFELARAYLDLGDKQMALTTFSDLIASSSHTSSYFALAAQLEKAKLEYSLLPPSERSEGSTAIQGICDTLKEVQIKRKLHSEPLHLEAGLCYIDIKTELAPPEQKTEKRRFLLEKMKESFATRGDPLVEQYLSAAEQFPEKVELYHSYLSYIDAEIVRLDAEKKHSFALMKEAKLKFEQLLTDASDATLAHRIRTSTEALGKSL